MMTDKEWEREQRKHEEQYDSTASYVDRTKEIAKEAARLRRVFKDIDANKKKLVNTTIEDIAFMTVTMKYLRETIVREGTTASYKNGENQYGTKQSPDAQLYLQFSQKQTQAMKILTDCLPKSEKIKTVDDDEFDDFVYGRKDV